MYGMSAFSLRQLRFFANPSFLPAFLIFAAVLFQMGANDRAQRVAMPRLFLAAAGLLAGCATQVHGSALALIVAFTAAAIQAGLPVQAHLALGAGFTAAYAPWLPSIIADSLRASGPAILPQMNWGEFLSARASLELFRFSASELWGILSFAPPILVLIFGWRQTAVNSAGTAGIWFWLAVSSLPPALYFFLTGYGSRYALVFHLDSMCLGGVAFGGIPRARGAENGMGRIVDVGRRFLSFGGARLPLVFGAHLVLSKGYREVFRRNRAARLPTGTEFDLVPESEAAPINRLARFLLSTSRSFVRRERPAHPEKTISRRVSRGVTAGWGNGASCSSERLCFESPAES